MGLLVLGVLALLPLPAGLVDALLMANLGLSVAAVLLAMYTRYPARSRVFPTLLLLGTLSRFALNLAVTRLLWCGQAGANGLIGAFGQAVMGEGLWPGIVLWVVLLVVQLKLIPQGVERVAQVSARYTLDAMPGQQMSVDAELYSGVMDAETARLRRQEIERSSDFYSKVEGSGWFVQAECYLASAFMVLHWAKFGLLLSLGNALVVTLGAGMLSLATRLMTTRAAVQANLGLDICAGVGGRLLVAAAGLIFVVEMARIWGAASLPPPPFWVLTGILHLGLKGLRNQHRALLEEQLFWGDGGGKILLIVPRAQVESLLEPISALRRELAEEMGFILPGVRLQQGRGVYRIEVLGREVKFDSSRELMLELGRLARCHAAQLADLGQLLTLLNLKGLSQNKLEQVLRNLLAEGLSIRKLDLLVDCLAGRADEEVGAMTERARLCLSRVAYKRVTGVLPVVVSQALDERILPHLRDGDVLLTTSELRAGWRKLTMAQFPRLRVVTLPELTGTAVCFRRLQGV